MARVDRASRQAWAEHPRRWVNVIVHVSGDVSEHVSALNSRNAKVTRTFRLTGALGIRCTGVAVAIAAHILAQEEPSQPNREGQRATQKGQQEHGQQTTQSILRSSMRLIVA